MLFSAWIFANLISEKWCSDKHYDMSTRALLKGRTNFVSSQQCCWKKALSCWTEENGFTRDHTSFQWEPHSKYNLINTGAKKPSLLALTQVFSEGPSQSRDLHSDNIEAQLLLFNLTSFPSFLKLLISSVIIALKANLLFGVDFLCNLTCDRYIGGLEHYKISSFGLLSALVNESSSVWYRDFSL